MSKVKAEDYVFPTSNPTESKLILEKVENAVNLKIEVDTVNEDIKAIAEDLEEKVGIPKAYFNKMVAAKYDSTKFMNQKELNDRIAEDLNLS